MTRRLLAIANALSGMSRAAAAASAGMDRQTLRDWVIRYNEHGVAGLTDRWSGGRPPMLTAGEQAELLTILMAGPDPEKDGFNAFTRDDLVALAKKHRAEGPRLPCLVEARRGSARCLLDQRYISANIYAAVEPGTDNAFALIPPEANGTGMQAFLDAFANTIGEDEHVALVLDGAGWHGAKALRMPANITPVLLPPYSPTSSWGGTPRPRGSISRSSGSRS